MEISLKMEYNLYDDSKYTVKCVNRNGDIILKN